MRKDDKMQGLQRERAYISAQLEETAKELARLDLLNLTLTQQKRQAIAAFNFIRILQEKAQKSFTIDDLYLNIVKAITFELSMDSAALLSINFENKDISILASAGLPEEVKDLKLEKRISKQEILEPAFANSKSSLRSFHDFIKNSFNVPYFVWSPISEDEDGVLVLFIGNKFENLMEKQPFSEASLETFGAISSMISLRKDNIAKTRKILKKKEEKIEFLAEILRTSPVSVIATDEKSKIAYINPATEILFGYEAKELIGGEPGMLNAESNPPQIQKEIMDTVRQGKIWRGEILNKKKKGDLFYVYASVYQLLDKNGNFLALVGFQEDITGLKRVEEALRESEKKYHLVVENANQGIIVVQDGVVKFFNSKISEVSGYSPEEIISKPFVEFIHPDDKEMVFENHLKRLQGEDLPHTYVFRTISKSSDIKWLEINATMIHWNDRPATLNFLSDITERIKMKEAIRQNEEYFRALIENALDVIFIFDRDGIIRYTSPSGLKVVGYQPEELIGQNSFKYLHPDDFPSVRKAFKEVTQGQGGIRKLEFRFQHRDGSWRMIEAIARNLLHIPAVQGIVVNARDITEQKAAEEEMGALQEQLRQSQKMEAIGRLAGGVAHDFNNLLSIIQGYSELSLSNLKQADPLRENIEQVHRASMRAADLTRQLLAFSRRQVMEMRVLDLNALLLGLDKMLRRVIGEDIELVIMQADGVGGVKADPGQIEQVIVNLVVNARDALPSGGKLTIETTNVELDEAYARTHIAVKPGNYVLLSISDTGLGMTPEVRDRVFEPFFTTKQKGTGLGLSTVYGIVKQSGGNIWVYSEPGQGTTFKIYLPRVDEPPGETREMIGGEDLPMGSETVLVVEDEEEVRRLTVAILRRQGYKVLEAPQGGDAFLICEQYDGPIHLMLTDVVMPMMDGLELAERLASMHTEMKVIYMSGYADNAIVRHGILREGMEYIQKPFTVDGLVRKVREVLDKDQNTAH